MASFDTPYRWNERVGDDPDRAAMQRDYLRLRGARNAPPLTDREFEDLIDHAGLRPDPDARP